MLCGLVDIYIYMQEKDEEREEELGSEEPDTPLPLTVTSRVIMD